MPWMELGRRSDRDADRAGTTRHAIAFLEGRFGDLMKLQTLPNIVWRVIAGFDVRIIWKEGMP